MKLELRISNYDLLDEYLKKDVNIIGFGDEYCEWAIFNVPCLKNLVERVIKAGKRVRIVTSFTTNECFESIVQLLEELSLISEEIEFVVNDYGVLQYLHKKEINKLIGLVKQKGYSLVPIKIYFKGNFIKLELGIGKGKKLYDKREDIAKKDAEMRMKKQSARY